MVKRVCSQSTDTRNQKQKPTPTATQDSVSSSAVPNPSTSRDANLVRQIRLNTRDNSQYLEAWEHAPISPQPMDVDSPSITKPPRSPPPQSSSLRKVLNPPFLLEHFYMDLLLLGFFPEYSRTGPPPEFKRIAYIIVLTCLELDRERFKKADDFDDLLQSFPVLDSISKDCWREGSFRALRELGRLQHRPYSSIFS